VFLQSFLTLSREKHYWAPSRTARIVWAVLTNLKRQIKVCRLLASPALRAVVALVPTSPFKYLSGRYLVRGLTIEQRTECFLHHYRRLQAIFPPNLLRRILQRDFTVYETREGGNLYTVVLGLSRGAAWEGELILRLDVDGALLYTLQFNLAPGWIIGSHAEDALLILRLQGVKGCYAQIHAATKAFRDVAPPALLLAVLQGVARICGVREMAGICATSQMAYSQSCSASFKEDYDNFFIQLGAVRSTADFYSIPFLLADKSVDHVKNGHKSRTRKRRAFRLQVAQDVFLHLSKSCEAERSVRSPNLEVVRMGGFANAPALPPSALR
jgi:uncharacterized protein VirK/YbjX